MHVAAAGALFVANMKGHGPAEQASQITLASCGGRSEGGLCRYLGLCHSVSYDDSW